MLIIPSCCPDLIIELAEKKCDNGSTICVAAEQTYSIAPLYDDQTLETREDLYISQTHQQIIAYYGETRSNSEKLALKY